MVEAVSSELGEVTLRDVARAAGVSASTASRALHGSRPVQRQNGERVRAAAARLGYAVDLHAQATARRESTAVSIVVESLTDTRSMEIAAGVNARAETYGYLARITICALASDRAPAMLRALRGERPRAIFVIMSSGITLPPDARVALAEYEAHGGSPVLIDNSRGSSGPERWRIGDLVAAHILQEQMDEATRVQSSGQSVAR